MAATAALSNAKIELKNLVSAATIVCQSKKANDGKRRDNSNDEVTFGEAAISDRNSTVEGTVTLALVVPNSTTTDAKGMNSSNNTVADNSNIAQLHTTGRLT